MPHHRAVTEFFSAFVSAGIGSYPAPPSYVYPGPPSQAHPGPPNQAYPGPPNQAYPGQPSDSYAGPPSQSLSYFPPRPDTLPPPTGPDYSSAPLSSFEEFQYSQFSVPNALYTTSAPISLTTAGHQDSYGVPLAGVVNNNDHGFTAGLAFPQQEISQLANAIGIFQ